MAKKWVYFIGSAPSSIQLAPYGNPDWEIWACSPGTYGVIPRSDRFFELHRYEPGQPWFSPEYCAFLKAHPLVYVGDERPDDIPNGRLLPIREMVQAFGPYFWTSTIAYMFALAILEGYERIGLAGVDMAAECVSYDTKVLTADLKWARADSVEVGDKLIGFDEEAHSCGKDMLADKRLWRTAEVLRNDRLVKPCYKVYFEDGKEIICSEDHLWLTRAENTSRWKYTKDLFTPHHRVDRPTRVIKLFDTWETDRSWSAGYLAAAFDGEGHLSQSLRDNKWGTARLGFSQKDNEMATAVKILAQAKGFEFCKPSETGAGCFNYMIAGGRNDVLRFLGSIRPQRLLPKFDPDTLGLMQRIDTTAVVKTEFIGDYPVIGLKTSVKTFVAEGFASHNSEYEAQRLGCQYFAMIAKAKGIEVGVPPESDLFRPAPMYGISESSHMRIKYMARRRELQQRIDDAIARQQSAKDESLFLRGALEDLTWSEHDWSGNIDSPSNRFLSPPPATALQTFHIDLHEVPQPSVASMGPATFEEAVVEKIIGKPCPEDLARACMKDQHEPDR